MTLGDLIVLLWLAGGLLLFEYPKTACVLLALVILIVNTPWYSCQEEEEVTEITYEI